MNGDAEAQYNIGLCGEYGIGVEKNLEFAKIWYKKASDQGHENAIKALQRIGGAY